MSARLRRLLLLLSVSVVACAATWWWVLYDPPPPPNYSQIELGLYLGGRVDEPPPGTGAVLNLCEIEDGYRVLHHRWEAIPDAEPAPSLEWLGRMVAFVDEHQKAGVPTYIHCAAGISRAGLVTTAYVMARNGWSRDRALEYVRTKRPGVCPNPAFMDLLLEWEGTKLP